MKRKPKHAIKRAQCVCTRCGATSEHWRYEFRKAGGLRCTECGGNVVAARYAR